MRIQDLSRDVFYAGLGVLTRMKIQELLRFGFYGGLGGLISGFIGGQVSSLTLFTYAVIVGVIVVILGAQAGDLKVRNLLNSRVQQK